MGSAAKIAFLCHPYHRGGVTGWMADAAIACSKQCPEVFFVTVEPERQFFSARGRETLLELLGREENTVHIISERVGYEFEFGTYEYRVWVYKRLLLKLPPGTPVILSDDAAVWEAATFLHHAFPVIGVLHSDEAQYYQLAEKYYSKVAFFACVSNRVKETIRKVVPGFDAKHIYTIPCGIDLPEMPDIEHHDGPLQMVFVGRVSDYQKRAGDLVKIAEALVRENAKFHLSIIGDGPAKQSLEDAVKDKGLEEYVSFPGWLPKQEVARHLCLSDLLLLTSDFEGTPIAMMEAFAAGCGLVGTRVSGIEDYEHHPLAADCLGVYPVGDIDEAVHKIKLVASIPRPARRLAARKLAETEFGMDVCLERYFKAIEEMAPGTWAAPVVRLAFGGLAYSKIIALARKMKTRLLRQ